MVELHLRNKTFFNLYRKRKPWFPLFICAHTYFGNDNGRYRLIRLITKRTVMKNPLFFQLRFFVCNFIFSVPDSRGLPLYEAAMEKPNVRYVR